MQTYHTVTGPMIVDSESGETYDKLAGQARSIGPKESRQRKRKDEPDISLEAKLVRLAMSEKATIKQIALDLGLKTSTVKSHLKRLGLDKIVAGKSQTVAHHTRSRRQSRRTVVH